MLYFIINLHRQKSKVKKCNKKSKVKITNCFILFYLFLNIRFFIKKYLNEMVIHIFQLNYTSEFEYNNVKFFLTRVLLVITVLLNLID